jgi:predicted ATPase
MLTRLKVTGFKNLVDVDVRFGPFTCVAGANGVGKSNLFDAILFLSKVAELPLLEAAQAVRGGHSAGVKSLFHRSGKTFHPVMSFTVEMIVPETGFDDLGQQAQASITFLQYSLSLTYREDPESNSRGSLEILREELKHIPKGNAHEHLLFEHSAKHWRNSVILGARRSPFVSTDGRDADRKIKVHQDGGSSGQPRSYLARTLPRTVLSRANAAESPTALLARREMQSWRLLQLEPSALRRSDKFTDPTLLGFDGSHLAATLDRLARAEEHRVQGGGQRIYTQVANRLAELLEDVREVRIDRDERRELLTLEVIDRSGTPHPASVLSDGSLRFLALAILELDPNAEGLLCFEEPENGVHPERISAMLRLLQDIPTDSAEATGPENPLRQVIINTHSPAVVMQIPQESLLIASQGEFVGEGGQRSRAASFRALRDTWRQRAADAAPPIAPGNLISYFSSVYLHPAGETAQGPSVADHEDLQRLIPFPAQAAS